MILSVPFLCWHAAQAGSLDTTSYWDGSSTIQPWGVPDTATYGQTFLAPEPTLTDFTFYIQGDVGVNLYYKAVVMNWAGSLLGGGGGGGTGVPLWVSPSLFFNGNGAFQAVTVTTPGVPLVVGSPYVMALTVSDPVDYAASTGTTHWGIWTFNHAPASASGGGGFAFYNNANFGIGSLTAGPWDNDTDFGDLAFKADFVPEPSACFAVTALGLAGFVVLRRVRRS